MKKPLRFLAILSFKCGLSLFALPLSASWVGSPADPAILEEGCWIPDHCWSSARFGVNGDFLLTKRMRPSRVSQGQGISHSELQWKLAVCDVGWNIKERFEIHFLAGPAASLSLRWQQEGSLYEAEGRRGMFWGASSKLILLEREDTTLGIDVHGGTITSIEGPLLQNGIPSANSFSSSLYFWQVATGFSQQIGPFKPYVGAAVNHLIYLLEAPGFRNLRLRDVLAVGVYEGCSLSFGSRISLNLEARQLFESGLAISGELRF